MLKFVLTTCECARGKLQAGPPNLVGHSAMMAISRWNLAEREGYALLPSMARARLRQRVLSENCSNSFRALGTSMYLALRAA